MRLRIPDHVRQAAPGRLMAVAEDTDVVLYLRESELGMRNYPRRCPASLRVLTWDIDRVLVIVLLLRLNRNDATTFEVWIDAGEPEGVRMLQCLAAQGAIDVHILAEPTIRSLRLNNPLVIDAAQLVNDVRNREAWSDDEFEKVCRRIATLYPTASSLWWSAEHVEQGPA